LRDHRSVGKTRMSMVVDNSIEGIVGIAGIGEQPSRLPV